MSNGILGKVDLAANVPYSIATCDFTEDSGAYATVNFVNRTNETITVWLAVTTSMHTIPSDDSIWIEYATELEPKATLERTGILVRHDEYATVKANKPGVTVTAWGAQYGLDNTAPEIFAPVNRSVLANDKPTTLYLGRESTIQGAVEYTIDSGSLPTGLTLDLDTGIATGTMPTTGYNPAGAASTIEVTATTGLTTETRVFNITKFWGDGTTASRAAPSAELAADLRTINGPAQIWIDPLTQDTPFQIYAADSLADIMTVPSSGSKPAWVDAIAGLNIISESVLNERDQKLIEIDEYHRLVEELMTTADGGSTPYFYWAVEQSGTLIGITRTRFYNTSFDSWKDHHTGDSPTALSPYGGSIVPEWSVWGTTGLPSGTEYVITDDVSSHVRSIPYRTIAPGYGASQGLHYKRQNDGEHYPWRDGNEINSSEGYFFPSSSNSLADVANLRHWIFISST